MAAPVLSVEQPVQSVHVAVSEDGGAGGAVEEVSCDVAGGSGRGTDGPSGTLGSGFCTKNRISEGTTVTYHWQSG